MARSREVDPAGDIWIQLFSCCITQQPPSTKRRRRIDRSMIGEPTDFRHTGHIGSSDIGTGQLEALQTQMKSKGGYDMAVPITVQSPASQFHHLALHHHHHLHHHHQRTPLISVGGDPHRQ